MVSFQSLQSRSKHRSKQTVFGMSEQSTMESSSMSASLHWPIHATDVQSQDHFEGVLDQKRSTRDKKFSRPSLYSPRPPASDAEQATSNLTNDCVSYLFPFDDCNRTRVHFFHSSYVRRKIATSWFVTPLHAIYVR